MRRTIIQLDEDLYQALRRRAFREERSLAAIIRDVLANDMGTSPGHRRPTRTSQFVSVAAGRSKQRGRPISDRHDEALVEAFKR